jgi:hypothetical protein
VSGVELGAARSNKEGKDIKELLEQVIILQLLFDLSLIGVCLLSWKSNMRKNVMLVCLMQYCSPNYFSLKKYRC